jgi:hypothetical protein
VRALLLVIGLLAGLMGTLVAPAPAGAVEAVRVAPDAAAIDLTPMIERYRSDGDLVQISTAPGRDGIVRRIAVKAREAGSRPDWIVFALTNSSEEQIERLLVAPHFRLVGSGLVWPDLGATRIAAITASEGIRPEQESSPDADLFQITLDPGTTVTFVAELASTNVGQLYLWEAEAYRQKVSGLLLYKGIIIGIAGLLALFLTIVFVVKGALIFPAAAALAWAVLAYACIDFGFFQRVFPLPRRRSASTARARGRARRDPPRLPVRVPEPEPLARPLQPRHDVLARLPDGARRARDRRPADRGRCRPHVHRRARGRRADPDLPPGDPRLSTARSC